MLLTAAAGGAEGMPPPIGVGKDCSRGKRSAGKAAVSVDNGMAIAICNCCGAEGMPPPIGVGKDCSRGKRSAGKAAVSVDNGMAIAI